MTKVLGIALAAGVLAGATAAQAGYVQYGGQVSGLAFNEVQDTPAGGDGNAVNECTSDPSVCGNNRTSYSLITRDGYNALHLPYFGNAGVNGAPPVGNLGQFRYTMFYSNTVNGLGNTGALNGTGINTTMANINWDGGKIEFQEGDPISLGNFGLPNGVTGELTILGGTLFLDSATDYSGDAGNTEDLPFGLGINRPINYEIDDGSTVEFRLELSDGITMTGTWNINNRSIDSNDPFNGVIIDPANNVDEDVAFFFMGETDDYTCSGSSNQYDPCGLFSFSSQYQYKLKLKDVGVKFAGWGPGADETPEPAALAILGLGLIGVIVARRRKGWA